MDLGNVNPNDFIINGSPDIFRTYKCKLRTIVRHPHNIDRIKTYAETMHNISIHTLKFLKLLYLHRFEQNLHNGINERITQSIPLDKPLIVNIAKTICVPAQTGAPPSDATIVLRNMLRDFYNQHYAPTIQIGEERPSYTNLYTPIDYMAIQVVTMFENNIKKHFIKYVTMYVDCYRDKINVFSNIDSNNNLSSEQKEAQKRQFKNVSNRIVRDILSTNMIVMNGNLVVNYQSGEDRDTLDMLRRNALPNKIIFHQASILEDLKQFPFDYLHGMLVMMKLLHQRGYKLPNLFPQKSSNIPGHFRIDTSTMIDMLYPLKRDEFLNNAYCAYVNQRTGGVSKANASKAGYMRNNQDLLWSIFFKTNIKGLFHGYRELDRPNIPNPFVDNHAYTHHYMIETNGVSASVICIQKTYAGICKPKNPSYTYVEPYIHDIGPAKRAELQALPNFAAIDPNKRDLLSCVLIDKNEYNNAIDPAARIDVMKNMKKWRHTQDKRRRRQRNNKNRRRWRHTKGKRRMRQITKQNRRRLQREKKETLDTEGISIQAREAELSRFDKKTLSFEAYKQYCYHSNKLKHFVGPFYKLKKHRNRQFRAFGIQQKLDTELINEFQKVIGSPATTVVFMGDWCDRQHRRFNEPVKGKGFRQLFRKAGYQVFLVDEFKTSKMCSECQADGAICETFRHVKNPKPKSRQRFPTITCHGLVRCTNCGRLWNRDPNAASNIWVLGNAAVNNEERPQYLRRTPNEAMDIDD